MTETAILKTNKVICKECGCSYLDRLARCARCNKKNPFYIPGWKQILFGYAACKWCSQKTPFYKRKCIRCGYFGHQTKFKNRATREKLILLSTGVVYSVFFFFLIFLLPEKQPDPFHIAVDGEIWQLKQTEVLLLDSPKSPTTTHEMNLRMRGVLPYGTLVMILDSDGIIDVWKKVVVLDRGGKPTHKTGWIFSQSVTSSNKVKLVPS